MVHSRAVDGRQVAGRRAWNAGLVVVAVAVVLALLLVHRARRSGPPARPPAVSDPEQVVAGYQGELVGNGGSRLVASLSPLHADEARQAFDARALARRLRLGEGEPWRLELRWIPEVELDPDAEHAADRSVHAEAPMPERWGLGLGDLTVADAGGTALSTLEPADRHDRSAPVDPLRAVLSPPEQPLFPGQAIDLVLWGRAPEGTPRLAGLLPEDDALRARFKLETGLERPFVLEPRGLKRSALRSAMARAERPPEGDGAAARIDGQAANLITTPPGIGSGGDGR